MSQSECIQVVWSNVFVSLESRQTERKRIVFGGVFGKMERKRDRLVTAAIDVGVVADADLWRCEKKIGGKRIFCFFLRK